MKLIIAVMTLFATLTCSTVWSADMENSSLKNALVGSWAFDNFRRDFDSNGKGVAYESDKLCYEFSYTLEGDVLHVSPEGANRYRCGYANDSRFHIAIDRNELTMVHIGSSYESKWDKYFDGNSVSEISAEAFAALQENKTMAEKGIAKAQYKLGEKYRIGNSVKKDKEQAALWFRKAAEQGYALAQLRLGAAYRYGDGVPLDANQAISWYEKSAAQDNKTARRELERLKLDQLAQKAVETGIQMAKQKAAISVEMPDYFLGSFEDWVPKLVGGTVPEVKSSVTCGKTTGCSVTLGQNATEKFNRISLFSTIDSANAALGYAKSHQKVAANSALTWPAKNLQPLLASDAVIDQCINLGRGSLREGYLLLCKLNKNPWGKPVALLMGMQMSNCGELFCGYEIFPLFRNE
jgi:TPR repeat protein